MHKSTIVVVFSTLLLVSCANGEFINENFCRKYKCICDQSNNIINCSSSLSGISQLNIVSLEAKLLDFSRNSIETLTIDDTAVLTTQEILLGANKIKSIQDTTFDKATQLRSIDLSQNQIENIDLNAFRNQHYLDYLNMSSALVDSYKLTTQLCPLLTLKVLDLSSLDLSAFSLECWRSSDNSQINVLLQEIHLANAKNIDKSWDNWFKYLGPSIKLIDLTNTNLKTIYPDLNKQLNLYTLKLGSNPNLDKALLNTYLSQDHASMKNLVLSDINADSKSLPLSTLMSQRLNLDRLDISSNFYDDSLTDNLLARIANYTSFNADNNRLNTAKQFDVSANPLVLPRLQTLSMSNNSLNSTFLYFLREISTVRHIDLSHNQIVLIDYQFKTDDMISLFAKMKTLTTVNLSHNTLRTLVLRFDKDHTNPIDSFDVSHNALNRFRILSLSQTNSPSYPTNIIDNQDDLDVDDDTTVDGNQRYLTIKNLDLSSNRFENVNIRADLRSILNLDYLDLSFNGYLKRVDSFSMEKSAILSINDGQHLDSINWNQLLETRKQNDSLSHMLCISEINLSNCKLTEIPSLQYICSKKLNFLGNDLSDKNLNLKLSKFTLSFLKYLDLQSNNLTSLTLMVTSDTIVPSDNVATSVTTYIDVKMNPNFKCDCDQITSIRQSSAHVNILSDCSSKIDIASLNCATSNGPYKSVLNKKILFLFIIIILIIFVLLFLIVYSFVSDIRNLNMTNLLNILFCCKRKFLYFKSTTAEPRIYLSTTNGNESTRSAAHVGGGLLTGHSSVPYVRLDKSEEDNLEIRFT